MAGNRSLDNHTFFENRTTIGVSEDYAITGDASEMTLEVVATGIFNFKITADNSPKSETFHPWFCFAYPSIDKITEITDATYLYNVPISAIDYLRIEITALTGSLSIYGKIVG